jgi:15-cis-phytoene synthase
MASLYVWGFDGGEESLRLSADRGIAFQLTNVLRDLREDSTKSRCYLPEDELARFHITPAQLADPATATSKNFLDLMHFQIDRARSYYEKSSPLESKINLDSRPTLIAMTAIYRGILEKIAANPAKVLTHRVRLSTLSKLLIGWRAMRHK